MFYWRDIDSVKLSTALQEIVKLNLERYESKDWNHFVCQILNRWGSSCHFDENVRNFSQVLLIIVSRYVEVIYTFVSRKYL